MTEPYAGNNPRNFVNSYTAGNTVASDAADLPVPCKGFHVNVTGTVKIDTIAGETVLLVVNAGTYYPYGVKRLYATGHTTLTTSDIFLAR